MYNLLGLCLALAALLCANVAVTLLSLGLWVAIVVLHIVCIVKGVNGQRLIIPGVSEYANRL